MFCGAKCEFYQRIAIQRLRTAPRHHPVSRMKSSLSLNPRQAASLAAMAISSNPLSSTTPRSLCDLASLFHPASQNLVDRREVADSALW